jgi:Mrp family chromosome partitioning ATPase/uncharacterized protein involved in exopolysaccharide biosynthesis
VLRQHVKFLIAATVAGAFIGGVAYVVQLYVWPVWSGQVVFEINPNVKDAGNALTSDIDSEETVQRIGQTESRRLVSKTVLEAAMKAPDIKSTDWGKEYETVDDRVQELEETLKVGHLRGTSNFVLSWSTQHKEDVPVVLNRIANTYMTIRLSEDDERFARGLTEFLKKRDNINEQIRLQSEAMAAFITKFNISDTSDHNPHSELRKKIENTNAKRDEAVAEVAQSKSRLANVDQKIRDGSREESDRRRAMDDYTVRQMQTQAENAEALYKARLDRFKAEHPIMKQLEANSKFARQQYEQMVNEAMQRDLAADKLDITQRIASASAVVEDLSKELTADQARLEDLTARATELERIKKTLDGYEDERKRVQDLISQVELLRLREDTQRVKLRQPAVTPREMSFPRLEYYVPLGAVLLLGLAAGIIFLKEFLDQRVRQPSDLLGLAGCRLLGVVPDLSDDPAKPGAAERVVRAHPNSVTAEMFRQVASQARKSVDAGGFRTIAVVAAHPEAGTTTLVSNLAQSAASAGRRVAVLDANFRRPRLAQVFGLDADLPGLGNMLKGEDVTPQVVDGVAVFPSGPPSSRVMEMLSGEKMANVIAKLREQYDLVLIDLPPSLVAGESLVITHWSDASMLVVRALQDQRGLVGKMVGQLLDTRAALIGCVLMRPAHTAGGYFKKNAEMMADYAQEKKAS